MVCIRVQFVTFALTVWLFNMNWTAVSLTSFLTLLYVQNGVKENHSLEESKSLINQLNNLDQSSTFGLVSREGRRASAKPSA